VQIIKCSEQQQLSELDVLIAQSRQLRYQSRLLQTEFECRRYLLRQTLRQARELFTSYGYLFKEEPEAL
jgi:hypothetical protein